MDYYLRPKHAFYAIKRELEPITVAMKRIQKTHAKDKYTRVYIDKEYRLQIWASSFLLEDVQDAKLVVKAFNVVSGNKIYEATLKEGITLKGNMTLELADVELMGLDRKGQGNEDVIVAAYIIDKDGKQLARRIGWPDPLK